MHKVSRTHPPDQNVLTDVSLSFFPGARIGVLGYNGSGKSTLLRIMAGVDTRLPRRGPAASERHGRDARAGAPARRVQGRARQRGGRGARAARPARPLQRARGQLLGGHRGRVRPPPGPHRGRRRVEPRHDAGDGDGRAAAAAPRRRRDHALRRRAPAGGAVPPAARARPTCCCWTSPPTTSTPSRSPGSSATSRSTRARSWRSPTTATSSTTWPGWILELDRGRGIPFKGNYSSWLEQKQERLAQEERKETGRQRTIAAELEWVRENPKGRRKKSQGAPRPLRGPAGRGPQREARQRPDPHPGGPAPRRRGDRGRRGCARASATSC